MQYTIYFSHLKLLIESQNSSQTFCNLSKGKSTIFLFSKWNKKLHDHVKLVGVLQYIPLQKIHPQMMTINLLKLYMQGIMGASLLKRYFVVHMYYAIFIIFTTRQ